MKILVFSDSHGNYYDMKRAINRHKNAEVIFFCGDGHNDIQTMQAEFPNRQFYSVKGNCDWYCDFPMLLTVTLCGKKILVTHGHAHAVKEGLYRLASLGHQENADIVLFGHTHHQLTTADGKMLIMNPGSIGFDETYGLIDIDEKTGTITAVEYPNSEFGPVVIK